MSNNLKTIQTAYKANRHPNGQLNQKRFDNYSRMPDMITNNAGYYWDEGFSKMYGRYKRLVEPGLVTDQLKAVTTNQDPITMSGTNKTDMNVLFRSLTQPSMSNVMQNYLFKTRYLTKL